MYYTIKQELYVYIESSGLESPTLHLNFTTVSRSVLLIDGNREPRARKKEKRRSENLARICFPCAIWIASASDSYFGRICERGETR